MRARAREERTGEGAREESGQDGYREFGVGGRERDELLPRARRGKGALFRETIVR